MAPIGSKNRAVSGPFLVPHFVNNLAWLWQVRREQKARNATQKIETREAQMNATKTWAGLKARNGPQLGGTEAW